MNSKKKARTSLHGGNSSSQDIPSTPNSENTKHLLTSCRRVGLNRKRNKSLGVSPISNEINKNIFVEEDLKKINETKDVAENVKPSIITSKVQTSFTSELTTKLIDISTEESISKPKINVRKKKVSSQRKRKVENDEECNTVSDLSQSNFRTESPTLSAKNSTQALDSNKTQSQPEICTVPVSIKLTQCDLIALKLTMEKNKTNPLPENVQEYKENLPTIPKENTEIELDKENTEHSESIVDNENSEGSKDIQEEKRQISDVTPLVKPNKIVSAENNLEDNSDGLDFYPSSPRRKKKKTKQRNTSKPGPSQQKKTRAVKRPSTNNSSYYSDSEDDFLPEDAEVKKGIRSRMKKLKLKKPVEDELNKTGHIRISETKSYTIIHKDNCVNYVKSFDNDNFKVTESDDNQQHPVPIQLPVKSMIIERKDYIRKRRDSASENAEILMEMPSIFTDLMNNLDTLAPEFKKKPTEPIESKEKISDIGKDSEQNKNTDSSENKEETTENPPLPKKSTDSSKNEGNSSESSESENNNSEISENDSPNTETPNSPLQGHEESESDIKYLTEKLAILDANIKKKQERLQSLQRISVYKETHNLVELRELTLQIKTGCQSALIDLVSSVKQQSGTNFTMSTLLEYMKIPPELVGYNDQEDKFI